MADRSDAPDTDYFENHRIDGHQVGHGEMASLRTLVHEELDGRESEADNQDLKQVLSYLKHPGIHHSEGRDLGIEKRSFSSTELWVASRLPVDRRIPYLLYRYRFNDYPRRQRMSRMPIILAIEPTSVCNIKCTMCFQEDPALSRDRKMKGFMSLALYRKIIAEAAPKGVGGIVLASRGEPLLHKDIVEFVRIAKRAGILDVKLNTNATRLTDNLSRQLLDSGLDTLVFSVDSAVKEQFERIRIGAKFDKIVENITRFNEIRRAEYPDSLIRTRISMVLLDRSQDTMSALQFWRGLVDDFAVRWAIPRLHIYENHSNPQKRPCSLLWERLYIWWDGIVNTCDEDYLSKLQIGRIAEDSTQTIEELWTAEPLRRYRELHSLGRKSDLHPCANCPGF
jgi:organic radical activating enzyme